MSSNTWSPPQGFKIKNASKIKVKSVDEIVNNSTVLQNDDDLFFPIGANEVWIVELLLRLDIFAVSDLKEAWTIPAGCIMIGLPTSTSLGSDTGISLTAETDLTTTRTKLSATNITAINSQRILVINGANAGTIQYQWAQNALEVVNTAVKKGSYLIATRLL